jgi:predicted transcriptional regulator
MEQRVIKGVSKMKTSSYRVKILKSLEGKKYLTPSEISKETGIRLNHISNFLKDLKDDKLLICLNETEKRGRLYALTELGKEVIKEYESK